MEPLDLKRLETEELPDLDPKFSSSQKKIVFPVMNESATKETNLRGDTIKETVLRISLLRLLLSLGAGILAAHWHQLAAQIKERGTTQNGADASYTI